MKAGKALCFPPKPAIQVPDYWFAEKSLYICSMSVKRGVTYIHVLDHLSNLHAHFCVASGPEIYTAEVMFDEHLHVMFRNSSSYQIDSANSLVVFLIIKPTRVCNVAPAAHPLKSLLIGMYIGNIIFG